MNSIEKNNGFNNVLIDKILHTIEQYELLRGTKAVLIGFSGGADSTALLDILDKIKQERGFALYAAHIHHGIRGEEALRDQLHCEQVCAQRGLPLFVRRTDVPALAAERGQGLEETAREERYRLFEAICAEHGIDSIAVAHHAGDSLETTLFHLARGTGLHGLGGIAPAMERGGRRIIRPMIECGREDIVAYCAANGLVCAEDSTNADLSYTRNYIRSEIVPRLKAVNPAAEKAVSRLCAQLRRDEAYLCEAALRFDGSVFDMPEALLTRLVRIRYQALQTGSQLSGTHMQAAAALIRGGKLWSELSLPGKIRLIVTREGFRMEPAQTENILPCLPLYPGMNPLPDGRSAILLTDSEKDIKQGKNIYKLFIHNTVNSDRIMGVLCVRGKRNGDRIRSGDMTRSVKKWMQAQRIPPSERAQWPLVCDEKGIVWIPGFGVRDDVKPSGTDSLLYVAYLRRFESEEDENGIES